ILGAASMKQLSQNEIDAFPYKMWLAIKPMIVGCTTPIYAIARGGVPSQLGTGSLFRVADKNFMVTAAHVREKAEKHKLNLFLSGDALRGKLVPLRGAYASAPNMYDVD